MKNVNKLWSYEELFMKRIVIMAMVFGLFGCGLSGPKKYSELKFKKSITWPDYKVATFTSKNHAKFFLIEDHELPLIKCTIYVKGGRYLVPKGLEGLDFILAQMLRLGGSKDYPGQRMDIFLEDRAVEYHIDFDFLNGVVDIDLLSKDFDRVMPVILDSLANPIFTEDNLLLAKKRLLTIIARRNDRQEEVGMREFKRIIYGRDSIWGRIPTQKSVEKITLKDVRNYYKRLFVGDNLLVGVVGDFDTSNMEKKLKDLFSRFKTGERVIFKFPHVSPPRGKKFIVDKEGTDQAFVVLGHIGDYRLNPDFAPLQVMNMVLSGGFSGRLFENIRTKMGLAYSVYGHFGGEVFYPGIFFVALKTKNSSVKKAIEEVVFQLEKLKDKGCIEREVEDAKEQFLNSLVFRYDSPKKIMERRLYYALRDMDEDSFKKLIESIKNVHAEDVNRVARKYLHIKDLDVLVVGDKKSLKKELDKLGTWEDWKLD